MSLDSRSNYYDVGGIETIKVIKAKLTQEQYVGFLLGNILKYGCRLNWKGKALRDSEKLVIYQHLLHQAINEEK